MITETDIAFQKGYKAAQKDSIAIVCDSLWEDVQRLEKAFPELAEGIRVAIDIITNKFSND